MHLPVHHTHSSFTTQIISLLDAHAGAIQSLTAIAILFVTCASLYIAWKVKKSNEAMATANMAMAQANKDMATANQELVREAKETREAQYRPVVAIIPSKCISISGGEFPGLVICNDSLAPAFDVTFNVDGNGYGKRWEESTSQIFEFGVDYLRPNSTIEIIIASAVHKREYWMPTHDVEISWRDKSGVTSSTKYKVSMKGVCLY